MRARIWPRAPELAWRRSAACPRHPPRRASANWGTLVVLTARGGLRVCICRRCARRGSGRDSTWWRVSTRRRGHSTPTLSSSRASRRRRSRAAWMRSCRRCSPRGGASWRGSSRVARCACRLARLLARLPRVLVTHCIGQAAPEARCFPTVPAFVGCHAAPASPRFIARPRACSVFASPEAPSLALAGLRWPSLVFTGPAALSLPTQHALSTLPACLAPPPARPASPRQAAAAKLQSVLTDSMAAQDADALEVAINEAEEAGVSQARPTPPRHHAATPPLPRQ